MRLSRKLFLASLILLVSLPAMPAMAATDEETIRRSFSLDRGSEVSLANINGNVEVSTWSGSEVQVTAIKKARASTSSRVKSLLKETKVIFTETSNGLNVRAERPKRSMFDWLNNAHYSVTFEVLLPIGISTDAETVNGNVIVEGVTGIQARSTNGRIVIVGGEGAIDAHTTNGGIRAELESLDGDVKLSSTNGGIRLALPRNANAELSARTVNGRVRTKGDIDLESTNRRRTRLKGTFGAGGPAINLRTVNGSITVES